MDIYRRIYESDAAMAMILILVPNIIAALVGWSLLKRAKNWQAFSRRVKLAFAAFVIISNTIAIGILSSLSPDHGFYWFDENEGGVWLFTLFPASLLLGLTVASLYQWKLTRSSKREAKS